MFLVAFSVSDAANTVFDLLGSAWTFISGNPLLVAIVASPLILGLVAALTSMLDVY